MGADLIPRRGPPQQDNSDWYNVFRSVLSEDLYPRNSIAAAFDQGGSLGTTTYRWLNAYLMALSLCKGANLIGLEAPAGMSGDYTFKLPPALPVSGGGILYVDSTGTSVINVPDDETLEITSTLFRAKDRGTTLAKLVDPGVQISSGLGGHSGSAPGWTTVNVFPTTTPMSVTVTNLKNPIWLSLIGVSGSNTNVGTTGGTAFIRIMRDSTEISKQYLASSRGAAGIIFHIDDVTPGTYTYTVEVMDGNTNPVVGTVKLVGFELQ